MSVIGSLKRSLYHMPFQKRLTANFGYAYPIVCKQLHPGTVWRQDVSALIRSQPMLAPAMGRISVTFATYFVPNRLMNDDWEDFITGGLNGTAAPAAPTITINNGTGYAPGSLADFLGLPTGVDDITHSAYPQRAYGLVTNNYLIDEQLSTPVVVSTASGPDTTTNQDLQLACWRRDYFTKARPSPQLGTAVAIPLLGSAPVEGFAPVLGLAIGNTTSYTATSPAGSVMADGTVSPSGTNWSTSSLGALTAAVQGLNSTKLPYLRANADASNSTMEVDLGAVAGPSVEEIRELSVIQRFKEKMNNYGARYVEMLQHTFGISPQDARLQLPEYLGGGEFTVQISEILQTSETDAGTPLGTLAGHGIGKGNARRIKYFVKEHGVLLTLMMIRPDTEYSQGIPREWMYDNKFDYLLPDFVNLGDQEVYKGEIYAQGTAADREVWGYTPRYEELRYIPSTSHGEFRKGQPLNYWTLTRQFDSLPALNNAFVRCDGTDRIFAVQDEDQFQITVRCNVKAKLPLPRNPQPRLK